MRESRDGEISVQDVDRLMNDMHKIVISPGDRIIAVEPQDYSVDFQKATKDPVGMPGMRLKWAFSHSNGTECRSSRD